MPSLFTVQHYPTPISISTSLFALHDIIAVSQLSAVLLSQGYTGNYWWPEATNNGEYFVLSSVVQYYRVAIITIKLILFQINMTWVYISSGPNRNYKSMKENLG